MISRRHLQALHQLVTGNRSLFEVAGSGVCAKCGQHFDYDPGDVRQKHIDDRKLLGEEDGITVLCPHCGADSALPQLTPVLIRAIHDSWF